MTELFRPEAVSAQNRLYGEVSLAPPVTWQLLGIFLSGVALVAALFLISGSYAKIAVVGGALASDRGVVRVVAPREGTIAQLGVGEGQHVRRGDVLAIISTLTEQRSASLQDLRVAALAREDAASAARAASLTQSAAAQISSVESSITGNADEAARLTEQMREQEALVQAAQEDFTQATEVAKRGYLSRRDLRVRETELGQRRQGLARLHQEAEALRARSAASRATAGQLRADLGSQIALVQQDRARVARQVADEDNVRTISLVAHVDGSVSGLAAHIGDAMAPGTTVLSIVPDGSRLEAMLEVPTGAAGQLRTGQLVRVAVDAYPYQTFGTIPARLTSLSAAAVPITRPDGTRTQAFVARAAMIRDRIAAYGRAEPLRAGMTVTARIRTQPRTFIQWILSPLYAVGRR